MQKAAIDAVAMLRTAEYRGDERGIFNISLATLDTARETKKMASGTGYCSPPLLSVKGTRGPIC